MTSTYHHQLYQPITHPTSFDQMIQELKENDKQNTIGRVTHSSNWFVVRVCFLVLLPKVFPVIIDRTVTSLVLTKLIHKPSNDKKNMHNMEKCRIYIHENKESTWGPLWLVWVLCSVLLLLCHLHTKPNSTTIKSVFLPNKHTGITQTKVKTPKEKDRQSP